MKDTQPVVLRRTKIVATLGPVTDDPRVLRDILRAGVDVVRLNFSHGTADDQRRRIRQARAAADELGKSVGVLADLQGPKIRIERFRDGLLLVVGRNDNGDFHSGPGESRLFLYRLIR